MITVDTDASHRVPPGPGSHQVSGFSLPPAMEYYYAPTHPAYRTLPPWLDADGATSAQRPMQMIYPEQGATLFVPVQLNGELGRVVFQLAHQRTDATVHWDLDGKYLGSTQREHRLASVVPDGEHT
ncbi:MAG: hypothetical protein IPP83_00465 [Flavobacteriales bacterium]|nr:hypothetical protein [Flavobacteriales bacterium]